MNPSLRAAREDQARRLEKRNAILSNLTPVQRSVITHPAKLKAILAGRRGGKTTMDASYLALEAEASGRKDWCLYSAVTRSVAKDLVWGELKDINQTHELGWRMREDQGLIETSRGAHIRLLGFDKMPEVEKACGYRVRLFIADEPHSYAKRLEYLVDQKLTAALGDLDGTLVLNGTPGIGRHGYWFKTSTGQTPGFHNWKWTVRQNPKFPRDPEVFIRELLERKKWTVETPAFRREILAEWCDDEGMQCYAYVEDRNGISELDVDYSGLFTLGVDFGIDNACAWTVWYTPPRQRIAIAVHSNKISGLEPDDATDITKRLVDQYKPSKIVGDSGGLGKAYVTNWNRRYGNNAGMFMHNADKQGKRAHMRTMSDEMRAERCMIYMPGCAELIDEYGALTWKDERKEEEDPNAPNDACDSALYGFTEHIGYLNEVPPPAPTAQQAQSIAQQQRIDRVQGYIRQREADEDEW